MRVNFRIYISCELPEGGLVDLKQALEAQTSMATHAKTLTTRLALLFNQKMDVTASIAIDDLPATYVNIKD